MKAPHQLPTLEQLKPHLPLLASLKLNGVRGRLEEGVSYSSSGKVHRNVHVQNWFERLMVGMDDCIVDGEIYSPTVRGVQLSGICNSYRKELPPDVGFHVFDMLTRDEWYKGGEPDFGYRYLRMKQHAGLCEHARREQEQERVCVIPQHPISFVEHLTPWLETIWADGGEGLMVRTYTGKYKHGRATFREANIWKLKQYDLYVGTLVDIEAQTTIAEEAVRERDQFGHLKQPGRKADRAELPAAGVLICRLSDGTEMRVGAGLTKAQRAQIWNGWPIDRGRRLKIKASVLDMKDKHIQTSFVGWC